MQLIGITGTYLSLGRGNCLGTSGHSGLKEEAMEIAKQKKKQRLQSQSARL